MVDTDSVVGSLQLPLFKFFYYFFFQPPVTKEMISRLLTCSDDELVGMLKNTVVWRFGKVY